MILTGKVERREEEGKTEGRGKEEVRKRGEEKKTANK